MKSYADDELKFCFLLPVEDSDEEEVKAKLVKCEACQMTLKECDMKKHQSTHNLTKPFHCEVKGCFKKFNTEENLALHQKYFHKTFLHHHLRLILQYFEQNILLVYHYLHILLCYQ